MNPVRRVPRRALGTPGLAATLLIGAPLLIGAAMLFGMWLTGARALVFPEGVALAFGVWTLRRPDWCDSPVRLIAAPTLCAVAGTLAAGLLPTGLPAELAALGAAAVILLALPARIGPALSAAVLPTVFAVHSWVYPLAVLAVTAVVLTGLVLTGGRVVADQPARRRWPPTLVAVVVITSAAWLALAAALHLPAVAAAPPLLVSCLEHVLGGVSWRVQVRHAVLVTVGWAVGGMSALLIHPPALAGISALAVAAALLWATRATHAPVLAMSLVPEVAGAPGSWSVVGWGVVSVGLAASVLYFLSAILARAVRSNSL